ncbi:hypothetical protein RND81_10G063900 [Saponaria officinalis]|uniref:Uncharacterized protein n=1 Tax=Saponaria officinalis TaxID=3572 RepID=A0AAW1HZC8_SAPOF
MWICVCLSSIMCTWSIILCIHSSPPYPPPPVFRQPLKISKSTSDGTGDISEQLRQRRRYH